MSAHVLHGTVEFVIQKRDWLLVKYSLDTQPELSPGLVLVLLGYVVDSISHYITKGQTKFRRWASEILGQLRTRH